LAYLAEMFNVLVLVLELEYRTMFVIKKTRHSPDE